MKNIFLLLTGIALLFSCKSTEESDSTVEQSKAPVEQQVAEIKPAGFLTSYTNIDKDKRDQLSKHYVKKSAHTPKFKQKKFDPNFTSYNSLVKGDEEQLNLRYISQNDEWHEYKQIKINPVQIWTNEDSNLNKIDKKELQNLLNYIHAQITQELSEYFELTEKDGPGVLNISIALSDGEASCVALETESSPVSLGLAKAFVKKSSPKLHQLINKSSLEIKVEDVKMPDLFFAGIDSISNKGGDWNSTKENFDFWSIRVRKELLECGAGK